MSSARAVWHTAPSRVRALSAQTEADVSRAVENALGANGRDLPFGLLYLFDGGRQMRWSRRGHRDRAKGMRAAPATIDLAGGDDPWSAATIKGPVCR